MPDLNRMPTSKVSATPKSLNPFKSILRPIFNMLQKSVDCLLRRSWKKRLSPDYRDILSRASPPLECKSEEEFLSILYKGIFIDGEGKWFWLDKDTGAKSYVISARKLVIIWSDDERYYRWIHLDESERCKFPEVAELLQVCWLDIAGSIDSRDLSPGTNYGAYLILKFVGGNYGLDVQPAQISVQVAGTVKSGTASFTPKNKNSRTAYLHPNKNYQLLMQKRLEFLFGMQVLLTNPSESVPQQETEDEDRGGGSPKRTARTDGWMEIELGTFFIDGDVGMVEISLKETEGRWKSGLIIEGIEVRPVVPPKKREERPVDEVSTVFPSP